MWLQTIDGSCLDHNFYVFEIYEFRFPISCSVLRSFLTWQILLNVWLCLAKLCDDHRKNTDVRANIGESLIMVDVLSIVQTFLLIPWQAYNPVGWVEHCQGWYIHSSVDVIVVVYDCLEWQLETSENYTHSRSTDMTLINNQNL